MRYCSISTQVGVADKMYFQGSPFRRRRIADVDVWMTMTCS